MGQRSVGSVFTHDPAEETLLPATDTEQHGHRVELGDPAAGSQWCQAKVANGLGVGGGGVLTPVTWVSQGRMGNFLQAPTPEGRLGCLKTLRLVFRGAGLESDTGGRADS